MTEPSDYEHTDFPMEDWQYEVACGDTVLGYSEWVNHKIHADIARALEGEFGTDV
jgi:hypothetical protein